MHSSDPRAVLTANVKHLVEKEEQILVFLKSKRDAIQCALRLAKALRLPPAQEALQALEETVLKAQLRVALTGGVALHHADLTLEERALVETHYRRGGIRVLACTTTLAFGVNLPASTVFLEATKWSTDLRTGAALEVPLSWAEYENISGRAGRLGFQDRFGRAVLIAANQFQADWLWRSYMMREHEHVTPAPGQKGLVDRVLNLVASKICLTAEEVQSFFARTYLGFQRAKETETLAGDVEKMLAALVRGQLIRMDEEGRVEATTLGEVTARKGVQAATAVKLARFFAAAGARKVSELELLYLLSLTADGKRMYIPLSSAEHRSRLYEKQVNQRLQENGYELGEELQGLLQARMLPTAQEVRGAKLALLAVGWIAGEEIAELEQHYQCYAGTIRTQMEQLSWLADAAAEIAQVMGWELACRLNDLAERLQLGVDTAGLMIARTIPGARRAAIKAMVASGVITPTTSSPAFARGEQTPESPAKQVTADLQLPLFAPQSS
ncbi:MAG TPA: helicase-related protein [Methylomirabilota bacterium]|nr:helicase-related protein [Methylomirabilota bacterium]